MATAVHHLNASLASMCSRAAFQMSRGTRGRNPVVPFFAASCGALKPLEFKVVWQATLHFHKFKVVLQLGVLKFQ